MILWLHPVLVSKLLFLQLPQLKLPRMCLYAPQTGEEVEFQLEVSDRGRKAINVTGKGGDILPARHMTQEPREGGAPGGARRRYSRDDE